MKNDYFKEEERLEGCLLRSSKESNIQEKGGDSQSN